MDMPAEQGQKLFRHIVGGFHIPKVGKRGGIRAFGTRALQIAQQGAQGADPVQLINRGSAGFGNRVKLADRLTALRKRGGNGDFFEKKTPLTEFSQTVLANW